ncbi:hypothetical protein [Anaerospora hongkongensis]|uniref:hypothetical protein n=1 Tax=Anaerospora hongkongensis TaxID=244830 RepID=UPI002899A60C|nr:hypothetical protein [Anaerospora hongkongensis]
MINHDFQSNAEEVVVVTQELMESMKQTIALGDMLKLALPPHLQKLLFEYEEAIGDTHFIESKLIYESAVNANRNIHKQPQALGTH